MINTVVLVGRLTKDPDLKYTQSGIAVTRFTLAVNRPFSNQQGQREADFVNCVTWRKQAENVANYLKKGSLAGIEGRIQTSNFEGKDGNRVFMTEVVADSVQFLETKATSQSRTSEPQPQYGQQNAPSQSYGAQQGQYQQQQPKKQSYNPNDPFNSGSPVKIDDDDLPF